MTREAGRRPRRAASVPTDLRGRVEDDGRFPQDRPVKIGLISPCGLGNLGDAAIQEAVIEQFVRIVPDPEFVAFTLNPEDTRMRHGVEAYPLVGSGTAGQGVRSSRREGSYGRIVAAAEKIEEALFDIRYVGRIWSLGLEFIKTLREEARHTRLALRQLRGIDLMVASGGGQLDDFWGGAWGHPYSMFKWALLAALARVPLVVLGVGVGSLRTPLSRSFVRATLRIAKYRSYRDAESVQIVRKLGVKAPHVHSADLAFGLVSDRLPEDRPDTERSDRTASGRVVGVSPMAYRDPRVWPRNDAGMYRDYVSRLGELCTRLSLSGRHEVVLFATTQSDMRTVRDVYDDVERRTDGEGHGVSVASTATIDELFEIISGLDLVVASRLHGVILSHIVARPVVALAYDRKVDRHMESMGQVEYLLSIDDFTVDTCLELVRRLQTQEEAVRSLLRSRAREHARQVRADIERAVSVLAEGRVPA